MNPPVKNPIYGTVYMYTVQTFTVYINSVDNSTNIYTLFTIRIVDGGDEFSSHGNFALRPSRASRAHA